MIKLFLDWPMELGRLTNDAKRAASSRAELDKEFQQSGKLPDDDDKLNSKKEENE